MASRYRVRLLHRRRCPTPLPRKSVSTGQEQQQLQVEEGQRLSSRDAARRVTDWVGRDSQQRQNLVEVQCTQASHHKGRMWRSAVHASRSLHSDIFCNTPTRPLRPSSSFTVHSTQSAAAICSSRQIGNSHLSRQIGSPGVAETSFFLSTLMSSSLSVSASNSYVGLDAFFG